MPYMKWIAPQQSFLLAVLLSACTTDTQAPLTPEEVVQQYQGFIDINQYDAASALSTPAEQLRLKQEAQIMALAPPDSTVFHTRFNRLACRQDDPQTTICSCQMEDEYGTYEGTFRLLKVNGVWRVDVPVEEAPLESTQPQTR